MDDPRKHDSGKSDSKEILPEKGKGALENLHKKGEYLPQHDLPLNDGNEAVEEEDAG